MKKLLQLNEHIKRFEEDENYINYFRQLALEYLNTDLDYVDKVMDILMDISIKNQYEIAKGWCVIYKGWVENYKGNIDNAIRLHKKALSYFEKNIDNKNITLGYAAVYNALLVDYQQNGYLDLAIENGLKGIEFSGKLNNYDYIVASIINTAVVYVDYKNYDEALSLLNRIKLYKHEYRVDYEIEIHIIKAQCNLAKGIYDKVDKYCEHSLNLIKENKFFCWENKVLLVMAEKLFKTGEFVKLNRVFKRALKISEEQKNIYMQGKILIQWAICKYNNNEYNSAERLLIKALDKIKDREYIYFKEQIYEYLSNIYESTNEYKKAYEYLKESNKCREIIKNSGQSDLNKFIKKNKEYTERQYKLLYDQIEKISELGKSITSNLEFEKCTEKIYDAVSKLMSVDSFTIGLYEKKSNAINYKIEVENGIKRSNRIVKMEEGKSLGAYCLKNKTNILINNMEKEYSQYIYRMNVSYEKLKKEPKSIIYISLLVENEEIGVMSVQSKQANSYTINDFDKLKIIGSYVAIAIKNLKLFNKVKYFAEYDILTECYNRNTLLKMARKDYYRSIKDNSILCVAMIDIDNFKSINDTYGHVAGDNILKGVSSIINNYIEEDDYAGRYGGEEFLIVFNKKDILKVEKICEEIRKTIEKNNYEISENSFINVTISIGVYEYSSKVEFIEGIKKADSRLYIAKNTGKNKVITKD